MISRWFVWCCRNFWEVFYEFSDEQKKQLLAFVTGSDRVPIGGLSKMKIIIVKNGPDSDRYCTAQEIMFIVKINYE